MSYFSAYTKLSRAKKASIIIAILVFLYSIGGFLVAPVIIKSKVPAIIAEQLGRKATVEQVRLNPFALSLTLRGFELGDLGGERFFSAFLHFSPSVYFRSDQLDSTRWPGEGVARWQSEFFRSYY
jgi:hypothetical protein